MSEQNPCETHAEVQTPGGYCPVCLYNAWQDAEQRLQEAERELDSARKDAIDYKEEWEQAERELEGFREATACGNAETCRNLWKPVKERAEETESALRRKTKECELIKQARDRYMPCPDHRDKTTEDDQCQMCRAEQAETERDRMRQAFEDTQDRLSDARQEAAQLRAEIAQIYNASQFLIEHAKRTKPDGGSKALSMWDLHRPTDDATHSPDAPASEPEKNWAGHRDWNNCFSCGRAMTLGMLHCDHCGAYKTDPAPADRPESTKGGCTCQRCGRRFTMDFVVPPETWERIKPEGAAIGGGLLCGRCITDSLEALGEATVYRIYNPDVGDSYPTDRPEPPPNFRHIDDVIAEFERDPAKKTALDEARAEIRGDRPEPSEALNEREYWSGFLKGRNLSQPAPADYLRPDYPMRCNECGRAHILDTSLPSEIWNQIARPEDTLCAVCIDMRLVQHGLTAEAEFYYAGAGLKSKLYEQPAPAVPDMARIKDVPSDIKDDTPGPLAWALGFNTCRERAFAAQPSESPAVPDGWKLVPIEPTEEMKERAINAPIPAVLIDSVSGQQKMRFSAKYKAAIAAAPTPDEGE